MIRACGLSLALLLISCNGDEIVSDETVRQAAQIETQRTKLEAAEREIAFLAERIDLLERQAALNSNALSSLTETVNDNARVANANAIRSMTRRGACGTEVIRHPDGTIENRRKECTADDLAP